MSVGMAVARNLHQAGVFALPELKHVAGNSGGAWFQTQFAYSEGFYRNVTGDVAIGVLVMDWVAQHTPVFGRTSVEEVRRHFPAQAPQIVALMTKLHTAAEASSLRMLNQILAICDVMLRFNAHTLDFTSSLLSRTDPRLDGLGLDQAGRHALFRGPDIHLQLASLTTAYLAGGPGHPAVVPATVLDAAQRPFANLTSLPMQYVVSSAATGFHASSSLVPAFQSAPGLAHSPLAPPFGGRTPTVAQIAAISSAFIGMLGSPESSKSFFAAELNGLTDVYSTEINVVLSDLMDATFGASLALACPKLVSPANTAALVKRLSCAIHAQPLFLAEMSVCTQALDPHGQCPFPATRTYDGGTIARLGYDWRCCVMCNAHV